MRLERYFKYNGMTKKHRCPRYVQDMTKKKRNNVEINIYGGNIQVMPNVSEVEQYIHTKDSETVIINKFKP